MLQQDTTRKQSGVAYETVDTKTRLQDTHITAEGRIAQGAVSGITQGSRLACRFITGHELAALSDSHFDLWVSSTRRRRELNVREGGG